MKITNPTNNRISVQVYGISYTIEPMGSIGNVPKEHANRWRDMIHSFVILSEDDAPIVKEIEVKEEIKEEVVEVKKVSKRK